MGEREPWTWDQVALAVLLLAVIPVTLAVLTGHLR